MKSLQFQLLVAGFVGAFAQSACAAENTQQVLREAQAAYLRGDIPTARKGFETVLRAEPKNQTAIGYIRMIAAAEKKKPAVASQQKQLAELIIPKIDLREASLGSTLDFLRQSAGKLSDGKIPVNFVVQVPEEQLKANTITLSLTSVPYTEALRYIGELARVTFAYEKFAIVVKPMGSGTPARDPAANQ